MELYKLSKNNLEEIKNVPFKLEKDIQSLVEENFSSPVWPSTCQVRVPT